MRAPLPQQRDLVERILRCQSFEESTRIVFEHPDLVDDKFFLLLRDLSPAFRETILEVILQAMGLIEDPEIVGQSRGETIAAIVRLGLASEETGRLTGATPAPVSPEDIERLLNIATERMRIGSTNMGFLLAIVHYAMSRVPECSVGRGSPDSAAFLRALGDVARGRILAKALGRTFDAIQYYRHGMSELEAQYERWSGSDKTTVESLMLRISNELIDVHSVHMRLRSNAENDRARRPDGPGGI